MKVLNKEQITDILYGCAILGTGGGGELTEGFDYIDKALAAGKDFKLISMDEVPAGEKLCTPYMLGAISPLSAEEEAQYQRLPQSGELSIMTAFSRLKAYSNDEYYGTICCELGGSNTAISFYLAAMMDGYIIDADPAGRAVPEITHSTYYINNLPAAPIVAANEFGECFISENIIDDMRAETVIRALAKVSRNDIAAIDHALPVEVLKGAVIEGSISKALDIGKAYRLAKEQNQDIAQAVAEHGNGFVAFRGRVKDFSFETSEGFTLGEVTIVGTHQYIENTYHIEVKNENMLARLNGEIDVTIPDLICVLDLDRGIPVTNPNFQQNTQVAVVVLPAPEAFLTPKGLTAFGPEYLGITSPYKAPKKNF